MTIIKIRQNQNNIYTKENLEKQNLITFDILQFPFRNLWRGSLQFRIYQSTIIAYHYT